MYKDYEQQYVTNDLAHLELSIQNRTFVQNLTKIY